MNILYFINKFMLIKKDIYSLTHKSIIICFLILLYLIIYYKKSKQKQIDYINFNNNDIRSIKKTFLYKEDKNISHLNNKNPINISLSIDNSHVYPSLVVMASCLENNDKKNHIILFYLLVPSDFDYKNIEIFESLKSDYDVRINYYYMINYFTNLQKWRGSNAIYYKLFIPILFPFIERMIHLDGDTIVFKDLWEMFNLPFNDNYFLGQPTRKDEFIKDKVLTQNTINAGVMLFNIKKLREDNKDFELLHYLFKKKFTEQTLVGYICLPKIGYLPFKYGIFFIGDIKTYVSHIEDNMIQRVNLTEVSEAMKDPTIVHELFCDPKHWIKGTAAVFENSTWCEKYQKIFYFYANKTKYYKKIYNKYMK